MKVLVHTGYLSYESFEYTHEYRTENNPLHPTQTKVYDVSTDEKYIKVMQHILTESIRSYYGYAPSNDEEMNALIDDILGKDIAPPVEPTFSLSDLEDSEKIKTAKEKYDMELEEYKSSNSIASRIKKFITSTTKEELSSFDVDFVNYVVELIIDNNLKKDEVPRYYVYDVIDNIE